MLKTMEKFGDKQTKINLISLVNVFNFKSPLHLVYDMYVIVITPCNNYWQLKVK